MPDVASDGQSMVLVISDLLVYRNYHQPQHVNNFHDTKGMLGAYIEMVSITSIYSQHFYKTTSVKKR